MGALYSFDGGFWPAREDYFMAQARNELREAGYEVSAWAKAKSLNKFGRTDNADSNTKTAIMELAGSETEETLATANTIDSFVADGSSVTGTTRIEGHYVDGNGDWIFYVQNITANGTTVVPLTQNLIRCTRLKNESANVWNANAYVYDSTASSGALDLPADAAAVKIMVSQGNQQSQKAATTISGTDCWILMGASFGVNRTAGTANVDFDLEYREQGGVWLPFGLEIPLRSAAQPYHKDHFSPYRIIYPNTDIRAVATSSADNTSVMGRFVGLLAEVQAA